MADVHDLTPSGRLLVLAAAFFGWLCAGVQMGLVPLTSEPAAVELLLGGANPVSPGDKVLVGEWFAWFLAAFLLGGATGGLVLGWVGDWTGRVRAIGMSILCLSLGSGLSWFVRSAEELLLLRFLTGLGVGGMWTGGVTLASEGWPAATRPVIAGVVGTAANVGIVLLALVGQVMEVTPATWRQVSLIAAGSGIVGIWVLIVVPESPHWLRERQRPTVAVPLMEVMAPPLLWRTLLGMALGTIPLLGTWGSGKWLLPWARQAGADPSLTQLIWATGAVLGSSSGGWLASSFGRRTVYFLVSAFTLAVNVSIYRFIDPQSDLFLPAAFVLGVSATIFFGWLPLYLPELFPTRVRATGAGISFNAGRIATAAGVLGTGLLVSLFGGNVARVGEVTAWVYALGLVLIMFAPDTSAKEEE